MAIIPLRMLSQFFRELPMLGSLSQMELRLMLNISQSNSWSATYAAPAAGTNIHIPASTNASQSVGDTCPFLLTNPATAAGLGMRVVGNNPTFTVTSNVGFYNSMPVGNLVAYGTGYRVLAIPSIGCSLWVPSVALNDPMREALLHKRTKTILYNDFQSDFTLTSIQPSARVQRLLTYAVGRLRKLYVIPFLNPSCGSVAATPNPRQSLLSSAPNTCSIHRFAQFQCYLGSNYLQGPWMQQNTVAGGDYRAGPGQMSGQITLSMWKRAYGGMVVDMERVSDSTVDDLIRSIQVSWINDTSLAYDYAILIEFENQIEVDSVTGNVVASDGGI
jgi:hypothetical protein